MARDALTNPKVGQQFLSRRTAQYHLLTASGKLRISAGKELANTVVRSEPELTRT